MTNSQPSTPSRAGLHPKRFLKELQQRLYDWQYTYLIFCFLVPVALMYVMYLVLWATFSGNGTPLVLDLNAQYAYFFEALREFVYGDNSLLYSFSRSLGGEFMGIYAYYLASPLSYIVALFPVERMQEAILTILLIKTGLCGLTFGLYLHKRSRVPNKTSVFIFSTLYALSAFAVVHQNNTMWVDALILLPLFVYALEELITKRRFKLYVITLSAILVCNYYIGYMVCIFAVLYFFYYYFAVSPDLRDPRRERLHFVRTGARFAVFSLLSAAISAFMLIAAYYSLGFGKTTFSDPSWAMKANFEIMDFLLKLLPGSYDTVEPAGLPFVYCGVITLILIPVYFFAKGISVREKLASVAMIAVFLISFIVNPIDLIWHGFSQPNWLNARYSFMFCFFLLVLAYKGLGNIKQCSDKVILAITGFLLLFVTIAEKHEFETFINIDQTFTLGSSSVPGKTLWALGCIWVSLLFIIAAGVLLCVRLKVRSKKNLRSANAVIAAVICAELLCNGIVCLLWLNKDVGFGRYSSYQDQLNELRPVISQVEERDNGFYRMEKTTHRTKNDNMALGLKGLSNSTSTLNESAIQLVNYMGYTGRAHLTMYSGGTPFSDSVFGLKYIIARKDDPKYASYVKLEGIESEKYDVYENPYALSLAFGVDSTVDGLTLDEYTTFFNRFNDMASAMLGEDNTMIFRPVKGVDVIPDFNCETSNAGGLSTKVTTADVESMLTFSYIAPYTGDYYFYSPVSWPTEMEAEFSANADKKVKYLGGDTNHILYAGHYNEGEQIYAFLHLPENVSVTFKTAYDFLWYLDSDEYGRAMTALSEGPQFDISPESTDDRLNGSITTSKTDQMILTTIPYDEGWRVYLDGEPVEIYKTLDALMAFDIAEAGEHTLELVYDPDCYRLGITLSVAGLVIFAVLCVSEVLLKRTLLKNRIPEYPDDYWVLEDDETEALSPPALTALSPDESPSSSAQSESDGDSENS